MKKIAYTAIMADHDSFLNDFIHELNGMKEGDIKAVDITKYAMSVLTSIVMSQGDKTLFEQIGETSLPFLKNKKYLDIIAMFTSILMLPHTKYIKATSELTFDLEKRMIILDGTSMPPKSFLSFLSSSRSRS